MLPSFSPVGILDVVFLDNTTNQMVNVTPGMNLTREREVNAVCALFKPTHTRMLRKRATAHGLVPEQCLEFLSADVCSRNGRPRRAYSTKCFGSSDPSSPGPQYHSQRKPCERRPSGEQYSRHLRLPASDASCGLRPPSVRYASFPTNVRTN